MNPFRGDKILRYPEHIAEWMRIGNTSAPVTLDISPTNRCPHNCPECVGNWRPDPRTEMKTEDALKWLKEFRDMGTQSVVFSGGGDPLAHKHCLDMIVFAKDIGYSVGLITNASALTSDRHTNKEQWPDRLAKACTWIRVSLDAATHQTFSEIHGVRPEEFDRVLKNIRALAEVPDRTAILGVGMLTRESIKREIIPFARLAKSLGVDYCQYRPFNFAWWDPRWLIDQARAEVGETATFNVLASDPKYKLMRWGQGWAKPYSRCHLHNFAAVLTADGEMHVCCDWKGSSPYGNLHEHSAAELWQSAARGEAECKIDLSKCPPLCRGNAQNMLLDTIASPMTHEEFL